MPKSFAKAAFTALCFALLAPLSSNAAPVETPIAPIATSGGAIAGMVLPSKVQAWYGIPFAAPPVQNLRWREPQPISWKGVYNADRKMPECMQVLRPHNINHYFGEEATSEDCLYMNIWAPAGAKAGDNLPVVVFIYGGGSTIGSSGMESYGGQTVAQRGAVFVNFNYRLGIMGFMLHPALAAESPNKASGNYAYLDQVAALKWIQANIAKFGGDPAKVVISGQSAGAGSVSLLQASPLAKGTFRGVLAMSGGAWANGGAGGMSRAEGEKIGLEIQHQLKANSLEDMRNVPADRILALQSESQVGATGGGSIRVGGSVDGYFLPKSPAELFASGQSSDVPVMLSFTHDESTNALTAAKTVAEYRAAAQKMYGAQADQFLALYPVKTDAQIRDVARAAAREGAVEKGMRNWALAQAKYIRSPAYVTMYSRVHPYTPGVKLADQDPATVGAYHTSDVPYWFGTQDAFNMFRSTRVWTPLDRTLSERMTASVVAFAKSGDPNTADVKWPAWTPSNERLVEFGDTIAVRPMNTKRLTFMAGVTPAAVAAPPRLARD
jgi:para-nitrobenzyl esterase